MITLQRLNRTIIALNPDLIERIEEIPDTVVTLTDGKKVLVVETIDEIVESIISYRALVSARSDVIDISVSAQPDLHLVPGSEPEAVASVSPLDENGVR